MCVKRIRELCREIFSVLCVLLICLGAESAVAEAYDDLTMACRYVRKSVYTSRDHEIAFSLTPCAVNNRNLQQIYDILTDVLEGCADYNISFDTQSGNVDVSITYVLRPALKIVEANRTGDLSLLSEDERRCMDIALEAVKQCRAKSDNDLELERALYDYVCAHVDYEEGPGIGSFGTEEYIRNSTSVGALLDGKTLCLGYAEVFYLLGRLAGLDVDMQYGFPDGRGSSKHAWNTIRIGQNTYMVDVCWGDTSADPFERSASHYGYFNLGEDFMPEGRHSHPEAEIAQISAHTNMEHTAFGDASGGVICESLQEAMDYAIACCRQGDSYAHVFIPEKKIELADIDPLMWKTLKYSGIDIKWGRLVYDFAGGSYIIFRWVHE